MKQISKSIWASLSIYLLSIIPAHGGEIRANMGTAEQNSPDKGFHIIGRAEKTVKSDRAIFSIRLSGIGNSLDKVLAKIKHQVNELKEFWKKQGIDPAMIHARDLQISVQDLEWEGHKKSHKYSIHCPIEIIIEDVDNAKRIQEKTMGFVEKDFVFSGQKLTYTYTKKIELQQQLTIEAIKNGQTMAQNYAKALGLSISSYPKRIKKSHLTTHSIDSNPKPYAFYEDDSMELENVFVVLVPMKYAIVSPEKPAPEPQEKI